MKRRSFLQAAFGASTFLILPPDCAAGSTADKGIFVPAQTDRNNEPMLLAGRQPTACKVSTADTNGGAYIFEHFNMRKGGPGRHLHYEQDEWFYAVRGEFIIEVGDERFRLNPGDSVFAPRMVPHVWAHVSDEPGNLLALVQPAGKFEEFFKELAKLSGPPTGENGERVTALAGIKQLGPPLKIN